MPRDVALLQLTIANLALAYQDGEITAGQYALAVQELIGHPDPESLAESCVPNKAGQGHHDSETGHPCSTGADQAGGGQQAAGGDGPAAAPPEVAQARKAMLGRLIASAGAKLMGAKEAAKGAAARVGQPAWDRMSPGQQKTAAGTWRVVKALEHVAMLGLTKGKELAVEAAKERGLPPEKVKRVSTALWWVDQGMAWLVNLPVVTAVTGNVALGKAASFLPMGSFGYLAYSTARDPWATARAARNVIKNSLTGKSQHESRQPVPGDWTDLLEAADGSDADSVGDLVDGLTRASAAGQDDWYMALVMHALDETGYDLAAAVEVANRAFAANPEATDADQGE